MAGEFPRLAGERGEDLLRDIGGAVRVSAGAAQRGAVNEIDVAAHEFGEGGLGAFLGVTAEQIGIIVHAGSL